MRHACYACRGVLHTTVGFDFIFIPIPYQEAAMVKRGVKILENLKEFKYQGLVLTFLV